jgi:hypothetical protein
MDLAARLFGEAWEYRRTRRRNRSAGLAVIAVAAVGGFLIGRYGDGSAGTQRLSGSEYVFEPSSRLLSQPPYMGVHCPVANSIACDQVGLAIMLKRSARSVVALIDGRPLKMNRVGDVIDSPPAPRKEFDGYLQPAGIRSKMRVHPAPGSDFWAPDARYPSPTATVRLLIDYGGGRRVSTRLRVPLSAGWG